MSTGARRSVLRSHYLWLTLVLLAPLSVLQAENAALQETPATDVIAPEAPDPALAREAEQRLDQLISEYGPYDPALLEVMSDLGAYYTAIEDHERAAGFYQDALQLVRVTEGLYSPRQLQILPLLIDSLEASAQWQDVDDFQHLSFFTQSRLHAPDSDEYLDSLHRYASWKLRAWQRQLVNDRSFSPYDEPSELREVWTLYDAVLDSRYPNAEAADPQKVEILYGRALAEMEIARHFVSMPAWLTESREPRYIMREVCSTVTTSSGARQRVCSVERVPNPEYRRGQSEEHRIRIDRVNQRLARTVSEMEALMSQEVGAEQALWHSDMSDRLAVLNKEVDTLVRQSRRAAMRRW